MHAIRPRQAAAATTRDACATRTEEGRFPNRPRRLGSRRSQLFGHIGCDSSRGSHFQKCKRARLAPSKFLLSDLAAIISAGASMPTPARRLLTRQLNRESRSSIPLIGMVKGRAKIFSDAPWGRDGIKSFWRPSSEWKWSRDSRVHHRSIFWKRLKRACAG
jgi:hypothetical protein